MNPYLEKLQPYPFEKLRALKAGCQPPEALPHIALSVGEPKHPAPGFAEDAIRDHLDGINTYPMTRGLDALRAAIADWVNQRFGLQQAPIDPQSQVLPVNGTREALFAFAQCVIDAGADQNVLMPNPFYQIYEGAALLAGARPVFYNTLESNAYLPDFDAIDEDTWRDCGLLYICTPGNPTGALIDEATMIELIAKAEKYDFVIASDECYSEIYGDESAPPAGLLQAARACGNHDYSRCVAFHSLSKRSNLPGLRSGFVAGDARILEQFLLYRTYHGCAMPPSHQHASIAAWQDEAHVVENRERYRRKFELVTQILGEVTDVRQPDAGFYLWLKTPIDDAEFARGLFDAMNVTVLPGSYLSREHDGINPGSHHVRMALVAGIDECEQAALRIRDHIQQITVQQQAS